MRVRSLQLQNRRQRLRLRPKPHRRQSRQCLRKRNRSWRRLRHRLRSKRLSISRSRNGIREKNLSRTGLSHSGGDSGGFVLEECKSEGRVFAAIQWSRIRTQPDTAFVCLCANGRRADAVSAPGLSALYFRLPIAFFFVLWYNRYNCDKKQCLEDVIYLKGVSGIYGSGIPCI